MPHDQQPSQAPSQADVLKCFQRSFRQAHQGQLPCTVLRGILVEIGMSKGQADALVQAAFHQSGGDKDTLDLEWFLQWIFQDPHARTKPHIKKSLKELLAQPDFIFDCCDTDFSGGLDENELPYALRAMGLGVECTQALQQLGCEPPLDRVQFAALVNTMRANAESHCSAELPHSLRGMSMRQFSSVNDVFVSNGWLKQQCDEYNKEHPLAEYPQDENMYSLDYHVVRPLTRPGPTPAREQDAADIFPAATFECSFAQLLNPSGCTVHYFVSHFWKRSFSSTVQALRKWSTAIFSHLELEGPSNVTFWICLFALNQHKVSSEVGKYPVSSPFNAALSHAEAGAVMIVGEGAESFGRIWCLYEVSRIQDLGQEFELICDKGPIRSLGNGSADEGFLYRLGEKLKNISVIGAQASNPKDREQILASIISPPFNKFPPAVVVAKHLKPTYFYKFVLYVKRLLAAPLFSRSMALQMRSDALEWAVLGARYTQEELDFLNPGSYELIELLVQAAWLGYQPEMRLLLRKGANINGTCAIPVRTKPSITDATPLANAICGGHVEISGLLLDSRADIETEMPPIGVTALYVAVIFGTMQVVEFLLGRRADANRANRYARPLIRACGLWGRTDVVKMLLANRADIEAVSVNEGTPLTPGHVVPFGSTALIFAALNGVLETVELLLGKGADVHAVDSTGQTALMKAATYDDNRVVELLLGNHADAHAVDSEGQTALMIAATSGHKKVVEILSHRRGECDL